MTLKILGDSQIPLLHEMFSSLGEVSTYTGRVVTQEQLSDVDILLTRSTLNVGKSLLQNTQVKFVGTCTIGTDHLDTDYLDQQNIVWANAAGCNADSVVQYVLSAMAQLSPDWLQSTVGIIACGNIGGRVYRRLKSLGVDCCCYDPFLSSMDHPDLSRLEDVLRADIITSHAPLTIDGEYPTWHLLGEREFEQLRPGSLLISVGRGAVLDNQALLKKVSSNKTFSVVLDVWENEPNILAELIPYIDIVTPHIAGYSLEGRENGSAIIFQALCQFLAQPSPIDIAQIMNTETSLLCVDADNMESLSDQQRFNQLLLAAYPIMKDDQQLRRWLLSNQSPGDYFDSLRRHYPLRREYAHFILPDWVRQTPFNQWVQALTQ
ncbi:hypothetical protein AB835_06275 [Candidatus Endobugula sertula]|uniref:Erythronate-4-phosphate dehydrogenase n=1 Tax=Candidatus Endobugula sertula TaxID=62101 RepID=A0A1D2QQW3_9GAMM|nr:hypothetical protein AB835_06275 [Candidatus Endobugula sertula]